MKRIHLSEEEKADLESLHYTSNDGKQRDRIKAVLLRSEGWTVPMISQALRIHETTVTRYLNDYRDGKLKNNSGGSESYLNEEQTNFLITHLEENLYHHNHQIVSFIKETWNIIFTISGLHKWLHRNGFSYKKPKGRPYKVDVDKQAEFIKEYNALKASAGNDEPILFMDSVHPTQATKITYGWIRTGKEKEVSTTASRTRLNIIGAIQLEHLSETITEQYQTINGDSIIDFMNKLREQYSANKKLHLIVDQAGYHKSQAVKNEAEKLNINLVYLPAYSPNLNPIERLWKVMNEKVRNNKFFKSAKDFKDEINRFFNEILPKISAGLRSIINDNFQRLNQAL
jgi:transposase